MTLILDIIKSTNSDTCRACGDQGRSHFKDYSPVWAISASRRPTSDAVNAL